MNVPSPSVSVASATWSLLISLASSFILEKHLSSNPQSEHNEPPNKKYNSIFLYNSAYTTTMRWVIIYQMHGDLAKINKVQNLNGEKI